MGVRALGLAFEGRKKLVFFVSAKAIRLIAYVPNGIKACFGRCMSAPLKAIKSGATRAKHASPVIAACYMTLRTRTCTCEFYTVFVVLPRPGGPKEDGVSPIPKVDASLGVCPRLRNMSRSGTKKWQTSVT